VAGDIFRLGLGEPIPVSAEHGEGLVDLHDALLPFAVVEPSDASAIVSSSKSEAPGTVFGEFERKRLSTLR
jgi:GTPase